MKIQIPPAISEEIFATIQQFKTKTMFWGGIQSIESDETILVEKIILLPSNLHISNIEEILSQQANSYDILLAWSENGTQDFKPIKSFCADMGIYFHTITQKSVGDSKPRKPKISNNPREKDKATTHDIEKDMAIGPKNHKKHAHIESSSPERTSDGVKIETAELRKLFTQPPSGIEYRKQQLYMIKSILDAFEKRQSAFIEASTGTGKSLAYLLPSIALCSQHGESVTISTHTKALQTQLLTKDIPKALELLNIQLSVGLAKGKSNYLCWKRFIDFKSDITEKTNLFTDNSQEAEDFLTLIEEWLSQTKTGDMDSLPTDQIESFWDYVNTKTEFCLKNRCGYFSRCFYYTAWNYLEKCDLVVTNHALLASQMEMDFLGIEYEIIPSTPYLIVDEAHHLFKSVLREHAFSSFSFDSIIDRLSSSPKHHHGVLNHLNTILKPFASEASKVILSIEKIQTAIQRLKPLAKKFFKDICFFLQEKETLRIIEDSEIMETLGSWEATRNSIQFILLEMGILMELLRQFSPQFQEEHSSIYQQILSYKETLEIGISLWAKMYEPYSVQNVVWIEPRSMDQFIVQHINLDNQDFLSLSLWDKYRSVILTSATLSINRSFEMLKEQLAFPIDNSSEELILPPVFDYQKNCLFLGITDITAPNQSNFLRDSCEIISEISSNISGGILILCTSWEQTEEISEYLKQNCPYRPLLVQGQETMEEILHQARTLGNAILIGVDSFWEGIDIPGSALECVIIVKIPFRPPGHPLTDALCEIEETKGHNSFQRVLLARAMTKFKQGFGRLLRSPQDKGVVICLDQRLLSKAYGRNILSALPIPIKKMRKDSISQEIKLFFSHKKKWL